MKKLLLTLLLALGLSMTAQGVSPVRVAVIDTGISSAAVGGSRIADGKNYIQPTHDTEDRHGHGTAVSSIIAQYTNAQLVPLVYYDRINQDSSMRTDLTMLAGIIRDAVDEYDCDIINLSSGAGTDTPTLRDAIAYAEQNDVLVVSAAGNDGNSALYYPGVYPTVLCVGTVNPDGTDRANFSNYFHGVDLLTDGIYLPTLKIDGSKTTVIGTSFSTAVVSGVAASLLEKNPNLTAYQLREILQSSATDLGAPGVDNATGYGRMNVQLASQLAAKKAPFPFTDVGASAYTAVEWALHRGITGGTTATTFSPENPCTRGQIVTFLWRAMGCPVPRITNNPFTDVKEGDYCYEAVLWALEKKVTEGMTATTFSPQTPCTQPQVTTFLWRALGRPNAGAPSDIACQLGEQYYTDAVAWADVYGLYKIANVTFTLQGIASRANIVSYLHTAACGD